ncbi:MAG TPA: hypothetical protein VMN38_02945 [Sphingomicrobium sp.]|nr:hypothetical protein [Sphingomicrobium sp.]
MAAPLATLAFLVTLWLVTIILAELLDEGLGKIGAALKGRSRRADEPRLTPVAGRVSLRSCPHQGWRARPQMQAIARAAA